MSTGAKAEPRSEPRSEAPSEPPFEPGARAAAEPRAPHVQRLAAPLALAVTVLLFAQWPLRDVVGAGALMANDVAQLLFALYVAVAVSAATRRGLHIAANPDALRRTCWRRVGAALAPLPWCAWLLVSGSAPAWRALLALEGFPESYNPGYFVIKLAVVLLAALLALECLRQVRLEMRRELH